MWQIRRAVMTTVLAVASVAVPCGAQVPSLPPDSILALLSAPGWPDRYDGLIALATLPSVPTALSERLQVLARVEAATVIRPESEPNEDVEGYGEYILELVLALGRLRVPATAPDIVRLGGLQVATRIQLFVAAQGGPVLGVLDSLSDVSLADAVAVLETHAMMISRSPDNLTATEYATVMSRVLRAGMHASEAVRLTFIDVTRQAPFPAFWPVISNLASGDSYRDANGRAVVQEAAQSVASTLGSSWNAMNPATILNLGTQVLDGNCALAAHSTKGHCTAAAAQWETAKRHVATGRSQPLQAALAAFRQSVSAAASTGGISASAAIVLLAFADRLELTP